MHFAFIAMSLSMIYAAANIDIVPIQLATKDDILELEKKIETVNKSCANPNQSAIVQNLLIEIRKLNTELEQMRTIVDHAQDIASCESRSFTLLDGQWCIRLFTDRMVTWSDAQNSCEAKGGFLVGLETSQKQLAINSHLLSKHYSSAIFWVGGRKDSAGKWSWVGSKKPFLYTNWDEGEPTDNEIESCLEIGLHNTYRWNNIDCDATSIGRYICEI